MNATPCRYDADHPPPLDFEAWTEISAEMLQRDIDEQDAVLDRRQLDRDVWDDCNFFWVSELAAQLGRSNLKLAERYGRRCAAELASRAKPRRAPVVAADGTALLTAIHDDQVLPFAAQLESEELAPATMPAPHPDAGATAEAPAPTLPLSTPFGRRRR